MRNFSIFTIDKALSNRSLRASTAANALFLLCSITQTTCTCPLVQVVQLRAIVLQTNQVLAQAEGVGGASLLHVPMTMKVKTEVKEDEEGEEGEQVGQMHHYHHSHH